MTTLLSGITALYKNLPRLVFQWPTVMAGVAADDTIVLLNVDDDGNLKTAPSAAPVGVEETPTITRETASGTVAAGARSVTFITSQASPVIGNGVDFAGTILGVSRGPGESITIPAQSGNTLGAIVYTITGGSSLDIIKTV